MTGTARDGERAGRRGSDDGGSVPWHRPTLHVIVANSMIAATGASLVSPALPSIRDGLTLTDPQTGLVLTVFSLPSILLAPVMGVYADRYGRRPVLIPSLLVFGLAGAAIAFTRSFEVILALRFLQGAAASGLITLSLTLVGDVFDGTTRNAVMGVNTAAMTIGVALYPVIGGYLADIHWSYPFLVYGLGLPVGLFAYFTLEEPDIDSRSFDVSYLLAAAERVLTTNGLLLYSAIFFLFLLYFGVVATAIPFLLDQAYGLTGTSIGLILSVPLVTSSVVALNNGRLVRYVSGGSLIALGFVAYGVGIGGVWLATAPIHVAATLVVLGVGHGFIIPSSDAAISALAPDTLRGGIMSLRISVKKIGQTAGPYLFATLGTAVGYPPLLVIVGVATVVAGGLALSALWSYTPARTGLGE